MCHHFSFQAGKVGVGINTIHELKEVCKKFDFPERSRNPLLLAGQVCYVLC